MVNENKYPTTVLPAAVNADNFLKSGGYCLYIRQPSKETLLSYLNEVLQRQSLNTDTSLENAYKEISYSLSDFVKILEIFNPQLFLAFNSDNSVAGALSYYEVTDESGEFCWIESWGSFSVGAGDLMLHFLATYSGQRSYDIYGSVLRSDVLNNIKSRPMISKDSATKWYYISSSDSVELGKIHQPYAETLENFSKICNIFPQTENPIRYDFNSDTWVDTVTEPKIDYGTPTVFELNTFYKFDLTTRTWVPNA